MELKIRGISKTYASVQAVQDFSLDVTAGITTLVGPSGCGKSTALRIIAGVEIPDSGSVKLGDRVLVDRDSSPGVFVPPHERRIGMVPQDYALWPNMTAFDNAAFGLRVRKTPKDATKKRVRELFELLGLRNLDHKLPSQLSGGEQQRVAFARALAYQPDLLLLDEPLSNVDAKLKETVSKEVRRILHAVGVTGLTVTHDMEEAFSMSDNIAIMEEGKLIQTGAPRELFDNPKSEFVMSFIGRTHMFEGSISDDGKILSVPDLGVKFPAPDTPVRGDCRVGIRSDSVVLNNTPSGTRYSIEGREISRRFRGPKIEHIISLNGREYSFVMPRILPFEEGEAAQDGKVFVGIPEHALIIVGGRGVAQRKEQIRAN